MRATFKKLLILLLLPPAALLYAAETEIPAADHTGHGKKRTDFHFSVEQTAGFRYGTLGEYLFAADSSGDYKKLSELAWDIKPIWYIGGKAELSWKFLTFSLYASGVIPADCGSMYDSDWIDLNSVKNCYSISETASAASSSIGTKISGTVQLFSWLKIMPFISADYECISLEADNGYGWYGEAYYSTSHKNVSWDSPEAEKILLQGIDYRRSTFFTWAGLSAEFHPFNFLKFKLGAYAAPFTYVSVSDHHHGESGGKYYLDTVPGYFNAGKLEASVSCSFLKFLAVETGFSWTKMGLTKGKTYSSENEDGPYYINEGYKSGADGQYLDFFVSVKFQPF